MPRACCAVALAPAPAADRITDAPFATRSEVLAPHAMAATSQPLATQIALDVMKRGGSAVDAAIVWDAKTKKLHGYNSSGRSPMSLSFERAGRGTRQAGRQGDSYPRSVAGHRARHGRRLVCAARALRPTADRRRAATFDRLRAQGFPVSDVISFFWQRNVRSLAKYPGIAEQFTRGAEGPAKGQTWTNPNLASTYEALARGGPATRSTAARSRRRSRST